MFRRREDELNDLDNSSQGSLLGNESVKVLNPQENLTMASAPSAPISQPSSFVPPIPPRAPSDLGSRGSYRPSTPAPTDVTRNRMQETKPSFSPSTAQNPTGRNAADSRRILTVGSDILLKGEIATCDRLVIEGKVDAVLNDVGTLELAESGSFKGVATVENAEISGLFEGDLVAKGRLVIYASGRVRGKITYGEIEIERGGEISGEIKTAAGASTSRPATRDKVTSKDKDAVAA